MSVASLQPSAAREGEPLSRLAPPAEADLPPHVAEIFARFRRQYGIVPNWLAAYSANPDTAYRLVTFYEHLFDPARSHLSAADRELVAVATSTANQCSYCVLNHGQALGRAINDPNRARRIGLGHHHVRLSAREQALSDFAERLTKDASALGDGDFARLAEQGLNDAAIVEVIEIVSFFNYANRLTVALNVLPDEQFFAP